MSETNMPTASVSDIASPVDNGKKAPFPFLRLPAELRNQVYGILVADVNPVIRLDRFEDRSNTFFASTGVCKQIRAEFTPILMNSCEVEIRSEEMFNFFKAFSTIPQRPKVLRIRVLFEDVHPEMKWDMRSFFAYLATAPRGYYCFINGPRNSVMDRSPNSAHNELLKSLFSAGNMPREFCKKVSRGQLSNVMYELKFNGTQLWTLVLKNNVGLFYAEVEDLKKYCEILCCQGEMSQKRINIKVENFNGEVLEEYMWVKANYAPHTWDDIPVWSNYAGVYRFWEKIGHGGWHCPSAAIIW